MVVGRWPNGRGGNNIKLHEFRGCHNCFVPVDWRRRILKEPQNETRSVEADT
jgi:hypothetical protein